MGPHISFMEKDAYLIRGIYAWGSKEQAAFTLLGIEKYLVCSDRGGEDNLINLVESRVSPICSLLL